MHDGKLALTCFSRFVAAHRIADQMKPFVIEGVMKSAFLFVESGDCFPSI